MNALLDWGRVSMLAVPYVQFHWAKDCHKTSSVTSNVSIPLKRMHHNDQIYWFLSKLWDVFYFVTLETQKGFFLVSHTLHIKILRSFSSMIDRFESFFTCKVNLMFTCYPTAMFIQPIPSSFGAYQPYRLIHTVLYCSEYLCGCLAFFILFWP